MELAAEMPTLPDWSLPEALDWISKVIFSEHTANFSLLLELRAGRIIATAIDPHTDVRTVLPAEHWLHVDRLETKGRIKFHSPAGQSAEARNHDLALPSADVQRIWRVPNENTTQLPELMSPAGDGSMPLYFVALWIATEGGTAPFDPSQSRGWESAYKSIIDAASSGSIEVHGKRRGKFKAIPARHFIEIAVVCPNAELSAELWYGDEMILRSVEYEDDFLWREDGFSDELVRKKETKWSQLLISKADVRLRWPYDDRPAPRPAGRPSSRKIVLAEFERRSNAKRLETTPRAQASALARWLKEQHPDAPPAGRTAIENMLRPRFLKRKGLKTINSV